MLWQAGNVTNAWVRSEPMLAHLPTRFCCVPSPLHVCKHSQDHQQQPFRCTGWLPTPCPACVSCCTTKPMLQFWGLLLSHAQFYAGQVTMGFITQWVLWWCPGGSTCFSMWGELAFGGQWESGPPGHEPRRAQCTCWPRPRHFHFFCKGSWRRSCGGMGRAAARLGIKASSPGAVRGVDGDASPNRRPGGAELATSRWRVVDSPELHASTSY